MTENKRFYIDNDGDLYDKQTNKLLMLDFGYGEAIYVNSVVECLNNLHEENQTIKKHIKELYNMVKIDVDNEIEVYPKTLMEYILNILKIIGDVE